MEELIVKNSVPEIDYEQILPQEVIDEILRSGLVIVGSKGTGKSNAAKFITAQIIKRNLAQLKIFDTCSNWKLGYDNILMQHLNEDTLLDPVYNNKKSILFDAEYNDPDNYERKVNEIIQNDFKYNRAQKNIYGKLNDWKLYCFEEAQSMLNTYSLNKTNGRFLLKAISEGRNFNLSFMFIGQRLAEISTKAIERCNSYLLGHMIGDNDKKKIKNICGKDSNIHNKVADLKQGEFIYFSGNKEMLFRCPQYISTNKLKLFSPKMNLWQDMK